MSSKTILSVEEILDEDMQVLGCTIDMGNYACMAFSYTLSAEQLFEEVKRNMSFIVMPDDGYHLQCTFDEKVLCVNGQATQWQYSLIESVEDHFSAIIFYLFFTVKSSWSYDEKQYFIMLHNKINAYLRCVLALQNGAIDIINIPPKSEPLEQNGFSFSHSELADAFRKSVIIKYPYKTTLREVQGGKPNWYVTGCTGMGLNRYPSTAQPSNSGGCYVATAVYGSYDCPEVWTLRRFRDYSLAKTWYGRAFIKIYYAISPSLVKYFGDTEWFQYFWKAKLDKLVSRLKSEGFEDKPYND